MRRSIRLPLAQLASHLLDVPEKPVVLDWQTVFGNVHPVEIEVGFGKGLFLATAARAQPETNFLGIEILRKYQFVAATRLVKLGVPNVRLAKADARLFLRDYVATASVQSVHVYFPDPWWKKRHQKRRVFTPEFVIECERVLCPGGSLCLATDVAEYFQVMTQLLAQHTHFRALPAPAEKQPEHDLDYLTNFERKFRKEGRAIYRATFEKR